MYTDFKMFTGENDHSETLKVSKYKSEACDLKKYIIGQVLIVQTLTSLGRASFESPAKLAEPCRVFRIAPRIS